MGCGHPCPFNAVPRAGWEDVLHLSCGSDMLRISRTRGQTIAQHVFLLFQFLPNTYGAKHNPKATRFHFHVRRGSDILRISRTRGQTIDHKGGSV